LTPISISVCHFATRYFLITPKLLPDLTYHQRMSIHTIMHGKYTAPLMDWNVREVIRRRLEMN
jgi:hypothetical protein